MSSRWASGSRADWLAAIALSALAAGAALACDVAPEDESCLSSSTPDLVLDSFSEAPGLRFDPPHGQAFCEDRILVEVAPELLGDVEELTLRGSWAPEVPAERGCTGTMKTEFTVYVQNSGGAWKELERSVSQLPLSAANCTNEGLGGAGGQPAMATVVDPADPDRFDHGSIRVVTGGVRALRATLSVHHDGEQVSGLIELLDGADAPGTL